MLSTQDNETLSRVGPGTLMGDLLRQFWLPAGRSAELPVADGSPLRVKLLGEELIAFRTTSGKLGLIQNSCPHRGASLFFGRNEEEGLRCVYHGWKFDTAGACVDMPSEPAESNFRNKVLPTVYPAQERNGIIWAYMGPREVPPPLPNLEANMAEGAVVSTVLRECNWMQALEGDIDTVHFIFLHYGHLKLQDTFAGGFFNYQVQSPAAEYAISDTDYGTCYGAYRPAEEDTNYWRIANFLFPFYTQVPPGTLAVKRQFRAWVPMDDDHVMFFGVNAPTDAAVENDPESPKRAFKRVQTPDDLVGTAVFLAGGVGSHSPVSGGKGFEGAERMGQALSRALLDQLRQTPLTNWIAFGNRMKTNGTPSPGSATFRFKCTKP